MPNRFSSGIYSIKHINSGLEYIGSSINIDSRWKTHLKSLKANKHHSIYLQRSWNKYGKDEFVINTLLLCDAKNLQMYEQIMIDGLKPAFNMAKSANGPVHRGQKLPKEWVDKVTESVKKRYASGFKIIHPPRSEDYRKSVSNRSIEKWKDLGYREKVVSSINDAMTKEEKQKRSIRTKNLWSDPEYRANAVASRKGKAYNKGYKCTPEQVENRRKAARISNTKRKHGDDWKSQYIIRYPEFAGDVNA